MQKTHTFALLAPVPEEHLISGLEAIAAQLDSDDLPAGHLPKVAFGSMGFEVLAEAEKLREGKPVEVLIYASHAKGEQPLKPQATWRGLYVGSIFRPQTTATDKLNWAVFWEIQELERLKAPIPIGNLTGRNKKTTYPSRFIPEGPVLIESP
jgi:hypothetical protein